MFDSIKASIQHKQLEGARIFVPRYCIMDSAGRYSPNPCSKIWHSFAYQFSMQYAGEKYNDAQLRFIQELTNASRGEIIYTIQLLQIHIEEIIKYLTAKKLPKHH